MMLITYTKILKVLKVKLNILLKGVVYRVVTLQSLCVN